MKFKPGDIVETILDGYETNSWKRFKYNYRKGNRAIIISDTHEYTSRTFVRVSWIKTNYDGTPVLGKNGKPLEQNDGGYEVQGFKLVRKAGQLVDIKELPKINL